MPSNRVTAAVSWGSRSASSIPWRTERAIYSGNSTAESAVRKNFSTTSLPVPFTLISKRLSCR